MLPRYFPFVDGLRGIAILAVFIYHLWPEALPGGFLGVDVFFVISGFVICHAFKFQAELGLGRFYGRRALRILPALILCVWFGSLVDIFFIGNNFRENFTEGVARSAHFAASNIYLIDAQFGYFAYEADLNSLLHTWSISVEEQFYILAPLCFLLLGDFSRTRLWRIRIVLGAVFVASLAIAFFLPAIPSYYLLGSRIWQFLLGAAAYRLKSHLGMEPAPTTAKFLSIVCLLLIGGGFYFARQNTWPEPIGVVVAAATAAALFTMSANRDAPWLKFLQAGPLAIFGRISYSLYLFHWPIFVLTRATTGVFPWRYGAVAALASVLVSFLVNRFVENPIRKFGQSGAWKPAPLAAGVAAILAISYFSVNLLFNHRVAVAALAGKNPQTWNAFDPGGPSPSCPGRETALDEYVTVVERSGDCPSTPAGKKIFIFGDSHAGSYAGAARQILAHHNLKFYIIGGPGCTPFGPVENHERIPQNCAQFYAHSQNFILKEARVGDVVFLPGMRTQPLLAPKNPDLSLDEIFRGQIRAAKFFDQQGFTREAWRAVFPFLDHGLKVVLEAPKPVWPVEIHRCVDWFNKRNLICHRGFEVPRAQLLESRRPVVEALKVVEKRHPQIKIWDPFPPLCPNGNEKCSPFRRGQSLFSDDHHLSQFGAAEIAASLEAALLGAKDVVDEKVADPRHTEPGVDFRPH